LHSFYQDATLLCITKLSLSSRTDRQTTAPGWRQLSAASRSAYNPVRRRIVCGARGGVGRMARFDEVKGDETEP
jgi:hypothetical protein